MLLGVGMGDSVVYIYSFFAMLVAAGAVLEFWVATRKRIAADTVERAEAHALRIVHDAERDGDSRAKIAILEARERVHELTLETERELKTKRQELASVARELDGRQQALTLQLADVDQRDRRIAEREKDLDAYDDLPEVRLPRPWGYLGPFWVDGLNVGNFHRVLQYSLVGA